tara:strand:- start:4474 stop:4665 length:192 start_codon:yes stop_codon:yes gene_type:complete
MDRKPHSLQVVRYEYNGKDIVIKQIKALDEKGKYIKFVKLEKVMPYLSKMPITFKQYESKGGL